MATHVNTENPSLKPLGELYFNVSSNGVSTKIPALVSGAMPGETTDRPIQKLVFFCDLLSFQLRMWSIFSY